MKRKIKKIALFCYRNNWIKWLVIPSILFIFWIVCSLLLNSSVSIFTLTQSYYSNSITQAPQGKLLKGTSIIGEFKASENNLGILLVKFAPHEVIDYNAQDKIVFRLKEKGANTYWYQGIYGTQGIYKLPFYPFGFPKISNSKDKIFVFSITSLKGNNYNALQLSNKEPIFVSRYVYTKSDLITNKKSILLNVQKKIINAFTDINFIYSSTIFLLPLIFYLFWFGINSRLRSESHVFLFIVPLFILLEILWGVDFTAIFFLIAVCLWVITLKIYKLESSISYLLAFVFFLFAFIAVLLGDQEMGGRLSNWTYIFLLIGTVQLLVEFKHPDNDRLSYTELFDDSIFSKKIIKKIMNFLRNEKR